MTLFRFTLCSGDVLLPILWSFSLSSTCRVRDCFSNTFTGETVCRTFHKVESLLSSLGVCTFHQEERRRSTAGEKSPLSEEPNLSQEAGLPPRRLYRVVGAFYYLCTSKSSPCSLEGKPRDTYTLW